MAKIADFRGQSLIEIAAYHKDTVDSLDLFFQTLHMRNEPRYLGSSTSEVAGLLLDRVAETELRSSLAILSAVEAALRIDYLLRCTGKKKDSLSRDFRNLYKIRNERVRLSDDILECWVIHHSELKDVISEFRGALRLRDWLAHGRYWEPKLGRIYTYAWIGILADLIFNEFPLLSN